MKSKIYYPPVSSEQFYKDEEPTSLPNSPSASSNLSPLKTYKKLSPGYSISSPPQLLTPNEGSTTKKGGMLFKVFGRRKSMGSTTATFDPLSQHLTRKLSSRALDHLQASEQQQFTDRATPTCSDLSGDSNGADVLLNHNSPSKSTTNIIRPLFRKGNITDLLERIPNLPPLQTPIWINTMKTREAHVSPKRRTNSVHFSGEDSFSFIESPASVASALGLKPPPLTFQESDKKMPALKSPPPSALKSPPLMIPPTKSQPEAVLQPEDLFEIEPGHSLPLRGRKQESKNYIQEGKEIATQECVCCEGMIHCVGDASLLLCPFCRVVQPLLLTSSEREAYGLALGFSSQEWIEMSSEEDTWGVV